MNMSRHNYRFRRTRRRRPFVREQPVWPLPALVGHPPVISTVDQVTHEAVLAYVNSPLETEVVSPVRRFFMPDSTPVLAMKSGRVLSADVHEGTWRVVIDHGNGFATAYDGLHDAITLPAGRKPYIKAGTVIGVIQSPASSPCPLRFTLMRTDMIVGLPGFPRAVDPLDVLLGAVSIPLAHTSMTSPPRKEAA
jgi:hypothetical protein